MLITTRISFIQKCQYILGWREFSVESSTHRSIILISLYGFLNDSQISCQVGILTSYFGIALFSHHCVGRRLHQVCRRGYECRWYTGLWEITWKSVLRRAARCRVYSRHKKVFCNWLTDCGKILQIQVFTPFNSSNFIVQASNDDQFSSTHVRVPRYWVKLAANVLTHSLSRNHINWHIIVGGKQQQQQWLHPQPNFSQSFLQLALHLLQALCPPRPLIGVSLFPVEILSLAILSFSRLRPLTRQITPSCSSSLIVVSDVVSWTILTLSGDLWHGTDINTALSGPQIPGGSGVVNVGAKLYSSIFECHWPSLLYRLWMLLSQQI